MISNDIIGEELIILYELANITANIYKTHDHLYKKINGDCIYIYTSNYFCVKNLDNENRF